MSDTTPEARKEALDMWCHWDLTKVPQELRQWVESGDNDLAWNASILVLVAEALTKRDAQIASLTEDNNTLQSDLSEQKLYAQQAHAELARRLDVELHGDLGANEPGDATVNRVCTEIYGSLATAQELRLFREAWRLARADKDLANRRIRQDRDALKAFVESFERGPTGPQD